MDEILFDPNETYTVKGSIIVRGSDNASIPMADGNGDYEAYKLWLAAGGEPVIIPEPNPRRAEILAELARIDSVYRTPRTLADAALGDEWAIGRLQTAETLAAPLRAELAELEQ
jgi:hypothetical protein